MTRLMLALLLLGSLACSSPQPAAAPVLAPLAAPAATVRVTVLACPRCATSPSGPADAAPTPLVTVEAEATGGESAPVHVEAAPRPAWWRSGWTWLAVLLGLAAMAGAALFWGLRRSRAD